MSVILVASCQSSSSGSAGSTDRPGSDASNAGFRDTFAVDKGRLTATGTSVFFSLRPGTVMTYHDDEGTTLTIRVLEETRIVDGVNTRIIEEREETADGPKEVSRNFFAIDGATGDVYYFGEDVDMYQGGKVSGHGGSWLAGARGARFGLAMPGRPSVGDQFQQECAPGVAMDRVEVVALDERVETPAGVFEHCVHVKETTPLEKDVGHKWYAPGVGLIKDDEFVLVSSRGKGA
jgi:hypothetical protein